MGNPFVLNKKKSNKRKTCIPSKYSCVHRFNSPSLGEALI